MDMIVTFKCLLPDIFIVMKFCLYISYMIGYFSKHRVYFGFKEFTGMYLPLNDAIIPVLLDF